MLTVVFWISSAVTFQSNMIPPWGPRCHSIS